MTDTERQDPAWRLIADALRTDIAHEVYPPGAPLPGESQLADRYEVSRPTVRRAITTLVGEGLLTVAHGRGTFVRPRPERRMILIDTPNPVDLLAEDYDPSQAGWLRGEHAQAVKLRRSRLDAREMVITTASRSDAETLGVRTGTRVLHRYQYWRHRTLHHTIAVTSTIPAHLLGLMPPPQPEEPADLYDWDPDDPANPYTHHDPDAEPPADFDRDDEGDPTDDGPDASGWTPYGQLQNTHGPVRFITTVTARMPYGDEIGDLQVSTGTAMLEVRRTMIDTHGRPLEVTTISAPADRFEVASGPQWSAATQATGGDTAAALSL